METAALADCTEARAAAAFSGLFLRMLKSSSSICEQPQSMSVGQSVAFPPFVRIASPPAAHPGKLPRDTGTATHRLHEGLDLLLAGALGVGEVVKVEADVVHLAAELRETGAGRGWGSGLGGWRRARRGGSGHPAGIRGRGGGDKATAPRCGPASSTSC